MTLGRLKKLITGITFGDAMVPQDPEVMLGLLEMAYLEIANHTTAMKLLTSNINNQIVRKGPGSKWIRMPDLPNDDTEELDVDNELCPAVARIIASYISKEKSTKHFNEAKRIMYDYQAKIEAFIKDQARKGTYDGVTPC